MLLVFIDNASGTLMELRLPKHGCPVALYGDKHTVFRVPKRNENMTGMTQFGRALAKLNIAIICASSSQARQPASRAQHRTRTTCEVLSLRDKRYVTKDLTLTYDHKRIRLEVNDLTRGLVGKYGDVTEMPDGRIQVRAKGAALPCSIFDPHQQRVTNTANKRLSVVLVHI